MATGKLCYKCKQYRMVKNGISSNGYQKYRCSNCGNSYTSKSEYVGSSSTSHKLSSSPSQTIVNKKEDKKSKKATLKDIILTYLFGAFGYWRFRNDQWFAGAVWFATGGLFGIGWVIDIVTACRSFTSLDTEETPNRIQTVEESKDDGESETSESEPYVNEVRPSFLSYTNGKVLKYSYKDVGLYILQTEHPNLENVKKFEYVEFVKEPENAYDKNAVYVVQDGVKIGYLNKGKIQNMVNDYIDKGGNVYAFVSYVDAKSNSASIDVGFYKKIEVLSKITLIGNKKSEAQSNILESYEGDEVSIEYDVLQESYIVRNKYDDFIGKLPKNLNNKLKAHGDINGHIESIDEKIDNNYNTYHTVTIILHD